MTAINYSLSMDVAVASDSIRDATDKLRLLVEEGGVPEYHDYDNTIRVLVGIDTRITLLRRAARSLKGRVVKAQRAQQRELARALRS